MIRRAPVALLFFVLVGCQSVAPPCPSDRPAEEDGAAPYGQSWVATRFNVDGLAQLDPEVTRAFFDAPRSYVLERWDVWPWAVRSQRTAYFASAEAFAAAVADGESFETVDAAQYDPESWEATPQSEQRDPEAAMASFAETAHAQGLPAMITPGLTIADVQGQTWCPPPPNDTVESPQDTYLRCNVAGMTARHADIIEIQAQSLQGDPEAYRDFVTEAAKQAREANHEVVVLTGLRSRPDTDLDTLKRTWSSVVDVVDGHYLSMNPQDAMPLLAWIEHCS